jgi:hypothetical protein
MFTVEFEILLVVAAFILGSLEGPRLYAWVKSWFHKEVTAVENKLTGHSGPTGA